MTDAFVDPFEVGAPPVSAAPKKAASAPASGGFVDPFDVGGTSSTGGQELSRLGHLAATVTDIPAKVGAAFQEGADKVNRHLNPFSEEHGKDMDAYHKELQESSWYDPRPALKSIGRTGQGLLGAVEAFPLVSGLTGLGRSILGHGYEAARPPDPRTPEMKQKMEAEGIHDQTGDEVADQLMAAIRPKGAPVKASGPQLPPGPFETPKAPWSWDPHGGNPAPTAPAPPELPKPNGPLGVRLSEGQNTGDLAKIQAEQGAYQGEMGRPAQKQATEFFENQQPAEVAAAKEHVGQELAPQSPQFLSADEAAQILSDSLRQRQSQHTAGLNTTGQVLDLSRESLRGRLNPQGGTVLAETPMEAANIASGAIARAEEQAKAATTAAYKAFEDLPGEFHPATFNRVASEIKAKVARPEDPAQLTRINQQTTPQANSALADLQDILGGISQRRDPDTGHILPRPAVTPSLVENARKRLNTFYGDALAAARTSNNWADVRAMEKVMDAFDAMVIDKLRTNFRGGSAGDVMRSLEEARALHREHRQTYFSRGSGDVVGPQIQKILGKHEGQAATPEQVSSTLYGNTSVPLARRLLEIFGANSPEIGAIKQGLFSHILEAPPGAGAWTPQKVADRIEQFTQGKGRSLTETYLSPNEVRGLQQYGQQLRAHGERVGAALDPVDQTFARITGGDGLPPASIEDTISQLFGGGLRSARYAPEVVRRLYRRFGANSTEAGAFRQGLLRHAMEDGSREAEFGPKKISDNLKKLANSEAGRAAYTPDQRELIRELAELHEKLIIPKRGANWSGTAMASKPMLDRILSAVAAGVAGVLTHYTVARIPFVPPGVTEIGAAYLAHAITPDLASRRAAKQMAKQLPLVADEMARYQKAMAAHNKVDNPLTIKRLTAATASLRGALSQVGIDLSKLAVPQLPATAPAGEGEEKGRAEGGAVEEDPAAGWQMASAPGGLPVTDFSRENGNIKIPNNPEVPTPPTVNPNEAFDVAAQRQRQAVKPVGGRTEGAITHGLEHLGEDIYKMGARPARIWNELQTVPPGQPLSERPDIVDAVAQTSLDVLGLPGIMSKGTPIAADTLHANIPPGWRSVEGGAKPVEGAVGQGLQLKQLDEESLAHFGSPYMELPPDKKRVLQRSLQEKDQLQGFHRDLTGTVQQRAAERMQVGQQYHEEGKLPFETGTRFSTEHSRDRGLAPWRVTGHYVDPKNPEKYGYYVERGKKDTEGWESSQVLVNHPKNPNIAKLAEGFKPFGEPKALFSGDKSGKVGAVAAASELGRPLRLNKAETAAVLDEASNTVESANLTRQFREAAERIRKGESVKSAVDGSLSATALDKFEAALKQPRTGFPPTEGAHADYVFHGTSSKNLKGIEEEGFKPGTYYTHDPHTAWEEANYTVNGDPFTEVPGSRRIEGYGGKPVVLAVKKDAMKNHPTFTDPGYHHGGIGQENPFGIKHEEGDITQGRAFQVHRPVSADAIAKRHWSERDLERRYPLPPEGTLYAGDQSGAAGGLNLYSAVERAIVNSKQAKAPGEQWASWLHNQPGIKKEELEWLGLGDPKNLPAEWKGPLTKEEVLEHVQGHGPGVKEVEKGGLSDRVRDELNTRGQKLERELHALHEAGVRETDPRVVETLKEIKEVERQFSTSPTRYHNYQLPGGENYRETLLTLPEKEQAAPTYTVARAKNNDGFAVFNDEGHQVSGGVLSEREAQALARQWEGSRPKDPNIYTSPHWPDDPNPLLHMRHNERDIPGVGKSLHLEELQSDWHQAGRKRGYGNKKITDEEALAEAKRFSAHLGEDWSRISPSDQARYIEAANQTLIEKRRGVPNVPDAPFKSSWPELGLKRALAKAVDEGKDAISWTPGAKQAERYNLSKQISKIEYDKAHGDFTAYNHSGNPAIVKGGVTPEQLPDLIGKDAAEKLLATTPKLPPGFEVPKEIQDIVDKMLPGQEGRHPWTIGTATTNYNVIGHPLARGTGRITEEEKNTLHDWMHRNPEPAEYLRHLRDKTPLSQTHVLEGQNLDVGGEGMKGFYDKMLVDKANAIGKKYGAKVEWKDLPGTPQGTSKNPYGGIPGEPLENLKVPVLRLTPELKKAVLEHGLPLFANNAGKTGVAAATVAEAKRTRREKEFLNEAKEEFATGDYTAQEMRLLFGVKRGSNGEFELIKDKQGLTGVDKRNLFDWLEGAGVDSLRKDPDFTRTLELLPKQPGVVYRGLELTPGQERSLLKQLKPGATYTIDRHSSATPTKKAATFFATGGDAGYLPEASGVLFEIQQRNGRKIPSSMYRHMDNQGYEFGWQREVILPKGTKMKVLGVQDVKSRDYDGTMKLVRMKEVR